jgi:hypothetical protein
VKPSTKRATARVRACTGFGLGREFLNDFGSFFLVRGGTNVATIGAMKTYVLSLCVLFAYGCSSTDTKSNPVPPAVLADADVPAVDANVPFVDAGTEPDAAPPAPDAANPCAQGTLQADGSCLAGLTFSASAVSIDAPRDHHTTFIRETTDGPYLYVMGGTSAWDVMFRDVKRAKVNADGSLSPFEALTSMPDGRAGHSVVISGDSIFVLGGVYGKTTPRGATAVTLTSKFQPDGTLSNFEIGPELPKAVMHLTSTLHDNHVYVFGGRGDAGSTTLCASAEIGADGKLGAFQDLGALTPDRSHHATFVSGGYVYLVGGLTGDPVANPPNRKDIIRAKLESGGKLGAWADAGTLSTGISVSGAQVYGDYVYILGGYATGTKGGPYTSQVYRARIEASGVGAFTIIDGKLANARAHVHQTPVWQNFLYSVGGLDNKRKSIGAIDIGKFE